MWNLQLHLSPQAMKHSCVRKLQGASLMIIKRLKELISSISLPAFLLFWRREEIVSTICGEAKLPIACYAQQTLFSTYHLYPERLKMSLIAGL